MADLTEIMHRSEFIKIYTGMESSGTQKGIIHIEDASDRLFWKKVVNTVCPDRYDIKPFSQPGAEGKRRLEKNYSRLHKDYLIAVDSDYDYLCPDRNAYSAEMNANPYVLHTFCYSRESFILTQECITDLTDCIHIREKTHNQINEALQRYSAIIYDALILFSWLHNRDQQRFKESDFNISFRLPEGFYILDDNLQVNEAALDHLRQSAQQYLDNHLHYLDDRISYQQYQDAINARGINPQTALLFINGHYLMDGIFRPIFNMLIKKSRKKDIEWVEKNYPTHEIDNRKRQIRNHYEEHCNAVQLIFHCDSYMPSPFWQKINHKLTGIIDNG